MLHNKPLQSTATILSPVATLPQFGNSVDSGWFANLMRRFAPADIALWQSTISLLAGFALARTLLFKTTRLPESAYFSSSILAEMVTRWPTALVLAVVISFVYFGWSRLRWSDFAPDQALRLFIGAVAGTLAWTFSVYDFNLYYGQLHLTERVLLVALFAGGMWRPVLLAPFLMLVYVITHQFDQPLSCTWTDKRVLFDILSLFVGWMAVRQWKPKNWPTVTASDLFFLAICLQAANYFIPGFGKLIAGWAVVERLDNLFIASYLNGWFGFLSQAEALSWARLIADWNPMMVWGSLLLELAGLVCLLNRRWCIVFFLACIGLHGMICLTTGILFWKWMILDLSLAAVLAFANQNFIGELFSARRFWLSVAVIALSHYVFSPPWLAWYDTELNEQYHLEAVTDSGEVFQVPRTFMVPYEVYFAQNKFHFLTQDKYVNGRYGTTSNWDVCRKLDGQPTRETAEAVREELGTAEYSDQKISGFDRFIERYFANLNARTTQHAVVPAFLQPPQHIYSVVPEPRYESQGKVALIRVIHERSLYQRDRIETLKREVVREIRIPSISEL
ncbi:MAG: hypothetical protein JWM11_6305 [Planctomycetaceae bacterium]|nr:hypothetical protein [Planctomycetaceae bacterium]